jgi:pimeloyl-ACP methyl ester carboxylesterase
MLSQPSLAFDISGSDGEPLVFLHGLACDRTQLSELISNLRDRYRTLNIDLPSHGQSRAARATSIAELASPAAQLVQRSFEGQVTLVGHSMGAAVCLEMARLLGGKVQHIIALDALLSAELYPRRGRLISFMMGAALACAYRPAMTRLLSDLFVGETPPQVRGRVIATALEMPGRVSARLLASLARWDRDRALAATDAPITIIAANIRARTGEIALLSPRCRIVRFPHGGHFFPTEFPLESALAIDEAIQHRKRSTNGSP